jgi:hypothetical protein
MIALPKLLALEEIESTSTYMKDFGNCCKMTREVPFSSLGNTFSTLVGGEQFDRLSHKFGTYPSYEYVFGQRGIGIFDLDEGELYATFGEVFDKVEELPLC